jgi:pSer/pThr/pTyr-binding forkhead associated (FHA) protein
MLIICSDCGHENQSDALFCDECGEHLVTNNSLSQGETTMNSENTYTEFTQQEINSVESSDREIGDDEVPTEIVINRQTEHSEVNNSTDEFTTVSENENNVREAEFSDDSYDMVSNSAVESETNTYDAIDDGNLNSEDINSEISDSELESTANFSIETNNLAQELDNSIDNDPVTSETDYPLEATDATYPDTDSPDEIISNKDLEVDTDNSNSESSTAEKLPLPSTFDVATRLQLDETSIQKTVSPATTLEVYQRPKAILVERGSKVKFVLPSTEKIAYIGRLNDEFPIQIDLSAVERADLISRVHAAIHQENEDFYLEDAGSANGTWLNNRKIEPGSRFRQKLNPGDTIGFGRNQSIALTFELEV